MVEGKIYQICGKRDTLAIDYSSDKLDNLIIFTHDSWPIKNYK